MRSRIDRTKFIIGKSIMKAISYFKNKVRFLIAFVVRCLRELNEDLRCKHLWSASMFTSGNHDYIIRCMKCKIERIQKIK